MLKIIEPKSHDKYRATIDSFLDLLEHHQNTSFSPELRDKATFVIASCKTFSPSGFAPGGEIYGGAIIYPQKISHLINRFIHDQPETTLGKLFSAFQPNGHIYWLARICLFRDHDLSVPLLEKLECRHAFYQQLYKALLKFGKKRKVKVLAFALRVSDSLDVGTYKYWPSLLEVKLPDSSNGYFYGLLSLKKRFCGNRQYKKPLRCFQPFAEANGSSLDQPNTDIDVTGRAI